MELTVTRLLELANGDLKEMRLMYCPLSDEGCIGDLEKFIEIYNEQLEKELSK